MPGSSPAATHRPARVAHAVALLVLALGAGAPAFVGATTPRVHAITGARIVTAPGQVIPRGTVVIRDGVIVAVGANVGIPADARVWEADSLTVYPGLIDAFVPLGDPAASRAGGGPPWAQRPAQGPEPATRGAASALASVTPELRVVEKLPLPKEQRESLRAAGFTAVHLAPGAGIVRGQSAVVALEDDAPNGHVVRGDAAQVIALQPARGSYPASLMGAIAVIRQTFLDAQWYRDARAAYERAPRGVERPATNVSWEALQPLIAGRQQAWFVSDEMLETLRASAIAKEAGVGAVIVGNGDEYKRAKEIVATATPLVLPVDFPEAPNVANPDDALEVTTEQLRHWDQAPSNPAAMAKAGATFAFTADGLKDVKDFRARVAKAIARGLSRDAALAAVTTTPARLLGLADRLGTIAPGKVANLTVTRGELFDEKGVVREVWVDGNRYETKADETTPKGKWVHRAGDGSLDTLIVNVEKDTTVLLVTPRDTLRAADVRLDGRRLRFRLLSDFLGNPVADVVARNDALAGSIASATHRETVALVRLPEPKKDGDKPEKDEPVATPLVMGGPEAWRAGTPAQPAAVLVKNATIWTAGPQGTLANADLLVRAGKIAAVGRGLAAPANAVVVDGTGKHVAPGIIDEHSHAAILGDVNECTNVLTCEVRIGDVVNSESPNLYRHLAGGTTVLHLLHGSCNAIGGQSATIKAKWGAPPEDLVVRDMPGTVKFALGENPKQSNWGAQATSRYPQSRAGVEQSIREAFTAARDYRAKWAEWRASRRGLPPRRDLQLDALVEIVEGRRKIHCHSYRQDEILMLMRVAEEFGFRVDTFTHILEGYKVADEMASHGASAMGFSDWWAYKFEVYDAIPYNGFLMWDRGVNTGFNSDDAELARRLNTEAAKAIKYGGVPPEEAIKFVTLNPAKSLHLEHRVGSLEPGKDADFAIWNGSPLSPFSACQQTWIEGRKYFDRADDYAGRESLAKERAALLEKAKGGKKEGGGGGGNRRWPPRYLEETALDGNACGDHENDYSHEFLGEAERRARANGEGR